MSELADLLSKMGISTRRLIERSALLERERAAGQKRWRGVSAGQVEKAMRGEALPRRVRAKLTRAMQDLAPGASVPWMGRPAASTRPGVVPTAAAGTVAQAVSVN